jgi:hypothetical protein
MLRQNLQVFWQLMLKSTYVKQPSMATLRLGSWPYMDIKTLLKHCQGQNTLA